MSYDPTFPTANTPATAAAMRTQLNGLRALIEAVLTSAVIDEVETLPPGSPATASLSIVGGVLHLSLGIPAGEPGSPGETGATGNDGNPGEVTNAALNDAIAGTARNPVGLTTLDTPYADPASEELRAAHNALFNALFRPPV